MKTRKQFKFPRKYSRSYCKKTSCKRMGFTQRSSCRPYKNCFQKGGNAEQIQHSVSQLKRFTERAKEGQEFNALQFGYNLGRAQEMVDGAIPKSHEIWWKPIEPLVLAKRWDELSSKIDTLKTRAGIEYDEGTVNKGKV